MHSLCYTAWLTLCMLLLGTYAGRMLSRRQRCLLHVQAFTVAYVSTLLQLHLVLCRPASPAARLRYSTPRMAMVIGGSRKEGLSVQEMPKATCVRLLFLLGRHADKRQFELVFDTLNSSILQQRMSRLQAHCATKHTA
jgi:hypothetical protein